MTYKVRPTLISPVHPKLITTLRYCTDAHFRESDQGAHPGVALPSTCRHARSPARPGLAETIDLPSSFARRTNKPSSHDQPSSAPVATTDPRRRSVGTPAPRRSPPADAAREEPRDWTHHRCPLRLRFPPTSQPQRSRRHAGRAVGGRRGGADQGSNSQGQGTSKGQEGSRQWRHGPSQDPSRNGNEGQVEEEG